MNLLKHGGIYHSISLSYCPLVWVFRSRRSNSLVKNVHEGALKIVYDDHKSCYPELLMTKN